MISKMSLTHSHLLTLLTYHPDSGEFFWIKNRGGSARAGSRAGGVHHSGYRFICVGQQSYAEHRLAWFYVNGVWPTGEIDHMNGVRADNRICNLQDVDRNANQHNRGGAHKGNPSKLIGVTWHKAQQKWRARIRVDTKEVALGYFNDPVEAHAAYLVAKAQLHRNNIRLLPSNA